MNQSKPLIFPAINYHSAARNNTHTRVPQCLPANRSFILKYIHDPCALSQKRYSDNACGILIMFLLALPAESKRPSCFSLCLSSVLRLHFIVRYFHLSPTASPQILPPSLSSTLFRRVCSPVTVTPEQGEPHKKCRSRSRRSHI